VPPLTRATWRLVALLLPVPLLPGSAVAQTGGFLESATSTEYREPLSEGTVQETLPARGRFAFPAPYSTIATRLTNATDCGGHDCVNYVGYSYWNNINNHVDSETMLIVLGLDRNRGGPGPSLFSYNKTTGETLNVGPLFDPAHPLSWATGEGWYFSGTRPSALYLNDGPRMVRYDVISQAAGTVYDVQSLLGRTDVYLWQMHSSADDRVHSATVKHATTFEPLGCVTYREDTGYWIFFPAIGEFDECQIDKSGRWLVIKDNLDRRNGEDNRVVDLQTGVEQVLLDENGAAGHSDVGFGYLVAEDNFASLPGAVRVWKFDEDFIAPGQGTLVYHLTSWSAGLGNVAHGNARPDAPLEQQTVCSSNATRLALPRVNEIVCYRLDDSLRVLVVAPNMTSLDAPGGGSDDYAKLPKGNRDVTGDYFVWTANAGTNRLDAFVVHVPQSKLAGSGATLTPILVTWASAVNLSTANNGLLKISGCDGCPDATAVSNETISGDGWVQWSAPEAQTLRVLGLSPNAVVTGAAEIPFAIRLQAGTAEVREMGTYTAETPFVAGDTFRITIEDGMVRYQKNGTTLHTSAATATGAMRIHAIVYGLNGALSSITAAVPAAGGGPDTTAPTAAFDSPLDGAVVTGSVVVSAGATDNVGVARVEFDLDGVLQSTDNTSPYQWAWNTAAVSDGSHILQAKAYDAAGNVGASATAAVTVRNAVIISLAVNVYKVRGVQKADLRWSGATSAVVTVYRDDRAIAVDTANDGFHTDNIDSRGNGRYTYRVCDTGLGVCSSDAPVTSNGEVGAPHNPAGNVSPAFPLDDRPQAIGLDRFGEDLRIADALRLEDEGVVAGVGRQKNDASRISLVAKPRVYIDARAPVGAEVDVENGHSALQHVVSQGHRLLVTADTDASALEHRGHQLDDDVAKVVVVFHVQDEAGAGERFGGSRPGLRVVDGVAGEGCHGWRSRRLG
jgi:hypothetical protein